MKLKEKILWALAGVAAGILSIMGITYANKTDKVINKAIEDVAVSKKNDEKRTTTVKDIEVHQEEIKAVVKKVEKELKVKQSKVSILQQRVADRKARETAFKKEKKNEK